MKFTTEVIRFRHLMASLAAGLLLFLAFSPAPADAQTWTQLQPVGGPSGGILQTDPCGAYDAATNRLIVYFPRNPSNDSGLGSQVWVLTNANGLGGTPIWSQLNPTGAIPNNINLGPHVVFDSANNRLIVYGGGFANTSPVQSRVFVLDNANGLGGAPVWSEIPTSDSEGRESGTAVYDPSSGSLITFGGDLCFWGTCQNDTRTLTVSDSLATWDALSPQGTLPGVRTVAPAVYDQSNNIMTIFGGSDSISVYWNGSGYTYNESDYNDVWELSYANGLGGTPAWQLLTPQGAAPSPRGQHSAVYDPVNNRMIVFGGVTWDNATQSNSVLGDLWILTHSNGLGGSPAWSQINQQGALPGPHCDHLAAFDAANQRMILFGGFNDTPSNGVWVLSLTGPAITSLSPSSVQAATAFTLTVNGSGFVNSSVVRWNKRNLKTTFVSPNQLTASVTAAANTLLPAYPGDAQILVVNRDFSHGNALITITAPTPVLNGINPRTGHAGSAGVPLSVAGGSFTPDATVYFGNTSLVTTFARSGFLSAAIPDTLLYTPGTYHVTVVQQGGTSNGVNFTVTPGPVLIKTVGVLTRDASNNILIPVTLINTSTGVVQSLQIVSSTLQNVKTTTGLPISLGDLGLGASGSATLVFPGSVGTSGQSAPFALTVGYRGGTLSWRVVVTLP